MLYNSDPQLGEELKDIRLSDHLGLQPPYGDGSTTLEQDLVAGIKGLDFVRHADSRKSPSHLAYLLTGSEAGSIQRTLMRVLYERQNNG